MTEREKDLIISEVTKGIKDEIAIYVGSSIIRWFLKVLGAAVVALSIYLIHNGYIKI